MRILILLIALLGGCLSETPDDPVDEPEDDTPVGFGGQETWYLHESGPCDTTGDQTFFMDKQDGPDDGDGCGTFGASPGGWAFDYPGQENSTGHASGSAISVQVFLQTGNPGPATMEWSLRAGGATVASGSVDATSAGPAAYTEFAQESTITSDIAPGSSMTFSINVPTAAGVVRGYDDDHTSMFTLG